MYKIRFYKDKSGNTPVLDYLRKLVSKTDKNSRIKANKIREYIKILKELRDISRRALYKAY